MEAIDMINHLMDKSLQKKLEADPAAWNKLAIGSRPQNTLACTAGKTGDDGESEELVKLARRCNLKVVSQCVQMIEEDGTFCDSKVEKLVGSATKLLAFRESYAIISIIGPQSSGKSYLLNELFRTDFHVMDARSGRSQTTKGILLAQSTEPCALIMDVEGADGRERGEDDVSFERQSALFALTVSDLMMINIWLHDIGREQGGGLPLLRTVFQERVKLDRGRTKVMVVIRAYDFETPFEILENEIKTKLKELWTSVHYRPGGMAMQFSDYIEVMVVALPDKVLNRQFKEEVTKLREWFANENIVGLRQDKNSTLGFSVSAKNIWEAIKQNKQLDLPSNKLAVSMYVCDKVANECLAAIIRDKDFERLNDAASSNQFIDKLEALLQHCVTQYDKDTEMSDETQRNAKRNVLKEKILQSAKPFAEKLLYKIRSKFFSETKDKVTDRLNKADDPAMEAPAIVEEFLESFTRSCGGLKSEYKFSCLESYNMLRNELEQQARTTLLNIKEQHMKEEVKRAKAQVERMTNEAKHEQEKANEIFNRKMQELDLAKAEVKREKESAEAAKKEADRIGREIKKEAAAAAKRSRSERSSYTSRLFNFAISAYDLTGIPDLLTYIGVTE